MIFMCSDFEDVGFIWFVTHMNYVLWDSNSDSSTGYTIDVDYLIAHNIDYDTDYNIDIGYNIGYNIVHSFA